MTDERLDQIELEVLRVINSGPADGRQKLATLAIELVAGVRRAKEVQASATAKAATATAWHRGSWELLREAVTLLKEAAFMGHISVDSPLVFQIRRLLAKVEDNAH